MMYILTQDELDKLVPKEDFDRARAALDWVRQRVMEACPHTPVACLKHKYCSDCWLSDIGPNMPGIERPSREISKAICPLTRNYPK